MPYEFITYEKRDRLVTITINRPEVMNAIHPPTSAELADAWSAFRADDDAWIALLTGAGDRAFCAGNDLKYAAATGIKTGEALAPLPGGFGGITRDFDCWKPMIAAVNGVALGGGLEMALACDIIVCADNARLGLPEARVGLMASAGGVHRLPRHIPMKVAMAHMLTGRHMTPAEALRWGLVNEVVPLADLLPAAHRWADEILLSAPLSVRATKEAVQRGAALPLPVAIEHNFLQQRILNQSQDAVEGPLAFAEKRPPRWTAR